MPAFIISDKGTVTFIVNGKQHTLHPDHPNYEEVKNLIIRHSDEDLILQRFDVAQQLVEHTEFTVEHGVVYYRGQPVHNIVTDQIIKFKQTNAPFDYLIKFLANCMSNPSIDSIDQLYNFLAHEGFPITADGCFVGYKGVRNDFKDKYTGTFDNSPGTVHSVPRDTVCDLADVICAPGLHVGTLSYARNWANDGKVVLVQVNPKNVVSVPSDHNFEKLRVCEYKVLSVYEEDEVIEDTTIDISDPLWIRDYVLIVDGIPINVKGESYINALCRYVKDNKDGDLCGLTIENCDLSLLSDDEFTGIFPLVDNCTFTEVFLTFDMPEEENHINSWDDLSDSPEVVFSNCVFHNCTFDGDMSLAGFKNCVFNYCTFEEDAALVNLTNCLVNN